MPLTQMDTILIRMLYLCAAGIVASTVLGIGSAASALFYLTFLLVVLLWLAGALRRVVWTDAILILTVGISLGHVIVNAGMENTAVGFGYLKKYLMFICTLVYFQAACKLCVDRATEKFILTVNSLLAVFLVGMFAMNSPLLYMIRGRISNYLTFGFTNPNLTALFLTCIFTGELLRFFQSKSFFGRLCHLVLAGAMCWFVWETESRNCLMTIALEISLCSVLCLTRHGFRLPKWFLFLVAVWPILFVGVYLFVMDSPRIQQMFNFMVSEGKNLDARMSVWAPAVQYYRASPILGAYSQISRGTGLGQMHNTHLDILASYGTSVLVLVCYLLYRMVGGRYTGDLKRETLPRICFCCTIIMGMGEAALFSGGLGIYLFAGMFLLLCDREQKGMSEGAGL